MTNSAPNRGALQIKSKFRLKASPPKWMTGFFNALSDISKG